MLLAVTTLFTVASSPFLLLLIFLLQEMVVVVHQAMSIYRYISKRLIAKEK